MLPLWVTKPEMILTYVLFLLAGLISVYSEAIRRFIKFVFTVPPNRMRSSWKEFRLSGYRYELFRLKELHNNPYKLLLKVILKIGGGFLYGVISMLGVTVYSVAWNKLPPNDSSFSVLILFGILYLVGVMLNLALAVGALYLELRHLVKFEERVTYLEKKITELG